MGTYRSKPKVIEATQFKGIEEIPNGVFVETLFSDPADFGGGRWYSVYYVITIHGQKTYVQFGDWIITEQDGIRHYPCKPDIFEKTYEPVD